MKKIIIASSALVICALLVFIIGRGTKPVQAPATPSPTAVAEPTQSPEPETTPATVRYRQVGALYTTAKAGDKLKVFGINEDWYAVELDGVTVYVEKRFIRLDSEQADEPWAAVTMGTANIYDNVYLDGDALMELSEGTKLKVIESMDWCLLAELADGKRVFISSDIVGEDKAAAHYYNGSGTSTGAATETAPQNTPSVGADGGDISLTAYTKETPRIVLLTGGTGSFTAQTGTVKADGVELYLRVFKRGDAVRAMSDKDGRTELLIDGLIATVPTVALLKQADNGCLLYLPKKKAGGSTFSREGASSACTSPLKKWRDSKNRTKHRRRAHSGSRH